MENLIMILRASSCSHTISMESTTAVCRPIQPTMHIRILLIQHDL